MQINAIGNNYYTRNINFGDNQKKNGMLNGAKVAVGAMATSAVLSGGMTSCDKFDTKVHNHYIEWPDFGKDSNKTKPVVTPPQIIVVEKIVNKTDTLRDTITVVDTVEVQPEWKSEVPPKQQEIYDNLGVIQEGEGKFFIKENYYDRKNLVLTQRKLDGQASSRNGEVLVYNVIKTKWDDEAETVVLGKNETYEKHFMYLDNDKKLLGIKCLELKNNVKFENDEKKSNWSAFKDSKLSKPDKWKDSYATYLENKGTYVLTENDFRLNGKKDKPGTVTVTNPHDSEWDLINFTVVKGDPD